MTKYVRLPITDRSFDSFVCNVADSLELALSLIRNNNAGFCIVKENGRMVGILCESEVRKAWIQGAELAQSCGEFINRHPLKMGKGSDVSVIMEKAPFIVIPEINESTGELTAVWQTIRPKWKSDEIVVLVMAGGRGSRMGELTNKLPKPLLEIADGFSLLDNVLKSLSDVNLRNVKISVNYLRDEFFKRKKLLEKKSQVEINFLEEDKFLGTGGPICNAKERTKGMLVMNGDVYTKASLKTFLDYGYSTKADMVIMAARQTRQEQFGVLSLDGDSRLIDLQEKPISQYFVSAGVYYFAPSLLDELDSLISNSNFDMPDLIKAAKNRGLDIRVFPLFEEWMDVGNPSVLAKVRAELQRLGGSRI